MLGPCNDGVERLYLQRGPSGDISVPSDMLAQHQIDGLRFLFSQYRREKLGLILNYPPGCGSSAQVAIFISAIFEKLKKPVLILYNSDQDKEAWIARFSKWTTISEDSIEIDSPNPYAKSQIFIKDIDDIQKLSRRSWGIVVVKSDSFFHVFQKCQLKADFKIWITAQDLKEDREFLRLVYTWINPSDKLLQAYLDREPPAVFKADTTNEILLDLLLEEFMITRKGLKPFGAQKRKHNAELPVLKVSKKNKDATGTKIKRSKKQQETPSTSAVQIEGVNSVHGIDESFKSKVVSNNSNDDKLAKSFTANDEKTDNDEESKMDVESFIRDNDPLRSDINLNFALNNMDNTSQPSETSSSKAEEELDAEGTLNFASAIADIIRIENDVATEICEDSISFKPASENVCDSIKAMTEGNVTGNDSTGLNQLDLSKAAIQKVFFVSEQRKSFELESDHEDKTEKESLDGERNEDGPADQTRKLEVSTSVVNETDSSFDSKMKELEERALRKFKGSVLDNIFRC